MDQAGRFQRNQQLRTDGGIVTNLGVDVVTGLAVLIYDFPGQPLRRQGGADIDGIPTVLAAYGEDNRGTLVVAQPSDATLIAPGEAVVDDRFVLQALTTLRDAASRGLVHGDLHAGRFLWADKRLYLEGYGVPWKPDLPPAPAGGSITAGKELTAALRADLRNAAAALLELGVKGISGEVAAALRSAAGPSSTTDATGLQAIVRRLAGGAVKVPSAGFTEIVLPVASTPEAEQEAVSDLDSLEFTPVPRAPVANVDYDPHDVVGALGAAPSVSATRTDLRVDPDLLVPPPARAPAADPKPEARPGAQAQEPDPITLHSDPGAGVLRTPVSERRAAETGFVKDLPPGATYRAGSLDDSLRPAPIRIDDDDDADVRRRTWRGPALLLLLLLALALASFLALRAQRNSGLSQVDAVAVRHLVDVRVVPGNLPPVSLIVDRSPDGSSYSPGTIIGSVPRRVSFDAKGEWVLHAQFQGRSSERVTLRVPEESVVVLTFPDVPPTTP